MKDPAEEHNPATGCVPSADSRDREHCRCCSGLEGITSQHYCHLIMPKFNDGLDWQRVSSIKHVWQCKTSEGQQLYCFAKGDFRSNTHATSRKAWKYGYAAYMKWQKKNETGSQQGLSVPPQQPGPQQAEDKQLQQAGTECAASQHLQLPHSSAPPSTGAHPDAAAAPPPPKKPRNFKYDDNSIDEPWTMHITPASQQQSPAQVIHATRIKNISKGADVGASSVLWSVSVPICGEHGLAAINSPSASLARLLAPYRCCGKCGTSTQVNEHTSSSSNSSSSSSAALKQAAGTSTWQIEASCNCSSCSVQMVLKYSVPFEHLSMAGQAAHGSASAYASAMQASYAKEFLDACSSCSNVVSAYALGQLPGYSYARPCMLLEL